MAQFLRTRRRDRLRPVERTVIFKSDDLDTALAEFDQLHAEFNE